MRMFSYAIQLFLGAMLALEVGLLVNNPSPIIAGCAVFVACAFVAHLYLVARRTI